MDYKYDVFISYTRKDKDADYWVHKYFKPMLQNKLNSLIPYQVEVFIDKAEIKIGNDWNEKIKSALANSRLFIPLYGPKYFTSEYCLLELWTFMHRQQKLNYKDGIICPIQLSDGKYNPDYVNIQQIEPFTEYFRTCECFSKLNIYSEFENKVISLAENIELRLTDIPVFDENWHSDNWWSEITTKVPNIKKNIFSKPQ